MSNQLTCAPPCEPLKAVKEKLEDPIYGLVALHTKIDQMSSKMDRKYAGKWVEKVLWGAGAIVGAAILGAIMALILK